MDWIVIGVSVITGFVGSKLLYAMADKGKDKSDPKANKDQKSGSGIFGYPSKAKTNDPKGGEVTPTHNQSTDKRLRTTPYDPRFPNQNQTRNCYQNYLDYHRCLKVKNDESFCHYYQWAYREICPKAWYEKWDDQRARGIFPGRI